MKHYDEEYQKVVNDKFDKSNYVKDKLYTFMEIDDKLKGTGV